MFRFHQKINKKYLKYGITRGEPLDDSSWRIFNTFFLLACSRLNHASDEKEILLFLSNALMLFLPTYNDRIKVKVVDLNEDFATSTQEEVDNEEKAIQRMVEEFKLRHSDFDKSFDLEWDESKKIEFSQKFIKKWADTWFEELSPEMKADIELLSKHEDIPEPYWNLKVKPMLNAFLESLIQNGANLPKERFELFIERCQDLVEEDGCDFFNMKF